MYKMPVVSKYFGTHILCILYVQHMHCSCINDAEVTPSVAFYLYCVSRMYGCLETPEDGCDMRRFRSFIIIICTFIALWDYIRLTFYMCVTVYVYRVVQKVAHFSITSICIRIMPYKLQNIIFCTKTQLVYTERRKIRNNNSVQSIGRTRSSSLVTLARPSVSSSLQSTNRSFTYASPYLWNQLPSSFRQPHSVHCPHGSPRLAHVTSSQSPPSLSSPIIASTFHSRLKTHLFHKSFPP